MAKCNRCGRKGLFFKVNENGHCQNCVTLINLENIQHELEASITANQNTLLDLEGKIRTQTENLYQYQTKRAEIYNEIKTQAEADAINAIQSRIDFLEANKARLEEECDKLTDSEKSLNAKLLKEKRLYDSYHYSIQNYHKDGETYLSDSFLDSLEPTVTIELQCMSLKQLRKLFNENKKLIQKCFERYSGRYTTKTNAALYKLMTIALEAELQNILYSIRYGKLESSIDGIKKMCAKYTEIATDGNQHIAPTIKKFIGEIEFLYIEAVKIEYEFYVQRERIKEEQRAIREQMRQEAEERKALEQERKRMEKESQKYQNEIEKIREQMKDAAEEQMRILHDRIAELQTQLSHVEEKKEQIVALENGKAGHVYIISNIGSFGEDVYKIGMTRRQDPMDRVRELGDASVPFPFDVHGMIFSDDAVALEHDLHVLFNDRRVNKVNLRKEFFNVSLDEIESVVDERCPSAEFRRTALAEQYRQSIAMSSAARELSDEDMMETVQ